VDVHPLPDFAEGHKTSRTLLGILVFEFFQDDHDDAAIDGAAERGSLLSKREAGRAATLRKSKKASTETPTFYRA